MIGRYAEFGVLLGVNPSSTTRSARAPSKAALKRALKDAPNDVRWMEVQTVGNNWQGRRFTTAELLAEGFTTITLVGPDPYTSRKWYGSLTVDRGGQVKVS